METVVLSQADLWLFYALVFAPAFLVWAAALVYMRYDYAKTWKLLEKHNKEIEERNEKWNTENRDLTDRSLRELPPASAKSASA